MRSANLKNKALFCVLFQINADRIDPCKTPNYRCLSGECIERKRTCDMVRDCFHGDDEDDDFCGMMYLSSYNNILWISF